MTSDKAFEKEIGGIVDGLECAKNFKCYRSDFKNICKAELVGTEPLLLVCLEKIPQKCKFLDLKGGYLCNCPLRIYIAKNLRK